MRVLRRFERYGSVYRHFDLENKSSTCATSSRWNSTREKGCVPDVADLCSYDNLIRDKDGQFEMQAADTYRRHVHVLRKLTSALYCSSILSVTINFHL